MMHKLTTPMWRDGELVPLSAVLRAVDENDWAWQVRDFAGVGAAPGGESMEEFEAAVRKAPADLTWGELCRFAEAIEQVQDCLIVGVDQAVDSALASIVEGESGNLQLIIEADDSTTWEFTSPHALLLERLLSRLGGVA